MSVRTIKIRGLVSLIALSNAAIGFAAEASAIREAQMTAAYVFNFVKFVEWPANPKLDVVHVCFAGAESVREALASAVADKRIGTRRIAVHSIRADAGQRCQVIYVGADLEHESRAFTSVAALTIGESSSFTTQGGIIRLYQENNRLRFVVNVDNAKRAGLQVSSNLLQLATRIEQGMKQ